MNILIKAWDEMVKRLWYHFDCPSNFPLSRWGTSKRKYRAEQERIQAWMDSIDWENVEYVPVRGAAMSDTWPRGMACLNETRLAKAVAKIGDQYPSFNQHLALEAIRVVLDELLEYELDGDEIRLLASSFHDGAAMELIESNLCGHFARGWNVPQDCPEANA